MGAPLRAGRRALPVTATNKMDKKPLRAERWDTDDPVWHRVGRSDRFVPLTRDDIHRLHQEFAANGRTALLVG